MNVGDPVRFMLWDVATCLGYVVNGRIARATEPIVINVDGRLHTYFSEELNQRMQRAAALPAWEAACNQYALSRERRRS